MGKHPFLALPLAVKGMTILKRNHPLGSLADMGNRAMGLEVQIGNLRWSGFSGQSPSLTSEAGHRP
jgi:hypothetical protein